MAGQLDAGDFARGLWYFFGIVTTAGIFAGIAGLGIGMVAGLIWEQLHRFRRTTRGEPHAGNASSPDSTGPLEAPKLQLVPPAPVALPALMGRTLSSIRFGRDVVELDFGDHRITTAGYLVVASFPARLSNSDPGWRDALCSIIGSRVQRVRAAPADRFEVQFEAATLLIPLSAGISANANRKVNES